MANKTLYLRGLPEELVRRAKVRAAEQDTTVADLVVRALERYLSAAEPEPQITALAADMDWYAEHERELLRDHEGDYVAIVDSRVVDDDREFAPLARRIAERYGRRPVFITRCVRDEGVLRVSSPRIASD